MPCAATTLKGWIFALACALLLPLSSRAADAPADEVAKLIGRLSAPKFIDRELATEGLVERGPGVIEPLLAALPNQKPETAGRIMRILRELSMSGDPAAEEVAVTALEKLVAQSTPIISQRASATLDSIRNFRQERAVATLKRAGAIFSDQGAVRFGAGGRALETPTEQIIIGIDWHGTEKDLKQLRCIYNYNHLVLQGSKITEEFLAAAATMPALEYLEIKRANLKDPAFTKLKGIRPLQLFGVYYTPMSDASLDFVQSLQVATEIKLYGTEVTPAGAEKLQAGLVGTGVDFKRGAFVGIGSMQFAADCQVNTLMKNSAAEKAGIELGDIIVKYNGQPVTDFDSFRVLINKNKAGDKVEIEVIRDGERLTKVLELGEWE